MQLLALMDSIMNSRFCWVGLVERVMYFENAQVWMLVQVLVEAFHPHHLQMDSVQSRGEPWTGLE